jgi:hypothetical protein
MFFFVSDFPLRLCGERFDKVGLLYRAEMNRQKLQLLCAAGLACLPSATPAHLLDGSPDPLPRWIPIAGLIIAGVMGSAVGLVISKHRHSMEQKKEQRLQRAAGAGGLPATGSPPPESAP